MNSSNYIPKDRKVSEKFMIEYQLSRLTRKLQDITEFIRLSQDRQWDGEMIVLVDSLLQLENIRVCKRIVERNL
jgi:hypothetical protein